MSLVTIYVTRENFKSPSQDITCSVTFSAILKKDRRIYWAKVFISVKCWVLVMSSFSTFWKVLNRESWNSRAVWPFWKEKGNSKNDEDIGYKFITTTMCWKHELHHQGSDDCETVRQSSGLNILSIYIYIYVYICICICICKIALKNSGQKPVSWVWPRIEARLINGSLHFIADCVYSLTHRYSQSM